MCPTEPGLEAAKVKNFSKKEELKTDVVVAAKEKRKSSTHYTEKVLYQCGNGPKAVQLVAHKQVDDGKVDAWGVRKEDGSTDKKKVGRVAAANFGKAAADHFIENSGRVTVAACGIAVYECHASSKVGSCGVQIASAGASVWTSDYGCGVNAQASLASVHASAKGFGDTDFAAPNASAEVVGAHASASATTLGVQANASASVAHAQAGFRGTPLSASASLLSADASASARLDHFGASAGASLYEAQAGPFAVRAGVKVGVEVVYGVTVVHAGPVSCSIM